jgi:ABC-type lipoprotein release transport system permease subunit
MNSQPSYWVIRNNLMSIPTYIDLLNKCNRYFTESVEDLKAFSIDDFPIEAINLKINPKMNIKNAINIISSVISKDNDYSAELWLFNNRKERLNTISNIVYNIFYTVSTIVLFFCFFNLTASMTINIFDQKKEIAILRALGMPKEKILFIFVAEAIVLILTSSLIGTIIGSLISYTMNLQWQVFNNINIGFSIKFSSLILIIVFSIIGGLLSTVIPAKKMLNESISELIRNSY